MTACDGDYDGVMRTRMMMIKTVMVAELMTVEVLRPTMKVEALMVGWRDDESSDSAAGESGGNDNEGGQKSPGVST